MTADPTRTATGLLTGLAGLSVPFAALVASTPEGGFAAAGLGVLTVGAVGAVRAFDRDRAETALAAERELSYRAEEQFHNLASEAYIADAMCLYCHGWHSADACPDIAEVA